MTIDMHSHLLVKEFRNASFVAPTALTPEALAPGAGNAGLPD